MSDAETTSAFAPGSVLGDYVLLVRLNQRVPEVWSALAKPEHIPVVITVLPKEHRASELAQRFEAERATLRRLLVAPNVVRLTRFGETEGHLWMEMPYFGEDLRSALTRLGRLPEPIAGSIAYSVLLALDAIHRLTYPSGMPTGTVHRDVSPENIFLSASGDVALGGFSGVCIRAQTPISIPMVDLRWVHSVPQGTPGYRPPEYVHKNTVTHQGDLWSLGVVLREMLTSTRLFRPDAHGPGLEGAVPLASTEAPITPALDRFVAWLTARDVASRAPTARAAADELYRLGRMATPAEIAHYLYPAQAPAPAGSRSTPPLGEVLLPWMEASGLTDPVRSCRVDLRPPVVHVDRRRREAFFHGRPLPQSGPGDYLTPQLFHVLAVLANRSGEKVTMTELAAGMKALGYKQDRDMAPDARQTGHKLRNVLYRVAKDLYASREAMRRVLENVDGALKLHVAGVLDPALAQRA